VYRHDIPPHGLFEDVELKEDSKAGLLSVYSERARGGPRTFDPPLS
jgi:hypothetical protein